MDKEENEMTIQEFFEHSIHTTEFWVGIVLGVIIWLIFNTDDITEWWYSRRKSSLQDEPIVKDSKVSEEIDQNFTKSSDDDLEKAANNCYYRNHSCARESFIEGANWQKERDHDACQSCENSRDAVFHNGIKHAIEQMKKEAVEGTVCKQRDSSQATWIELAPNSLPAFDDCELVKCIILKDENGDSCTRS